MTKIFLRLVLMRLLQAVPTLWGVATIVFLLMHIAPGDPIEVMLGEGMPAADRAALTHALGLDRPLWQQYLAYLAGAVQGELGLSIFDQRPVIEHIAARLPATIELAMAGLLVAVLIGLPLGWFAARRAGGAWDGALSAAALIGVSVPNFWLGPMLVLVFSLALGWLPVSGKEAPGAIVLPAITLGSALAAMLMRMTRTALLEAYAEDSVRVMRAFGASERRIWLFALPRLAAPPVVTVFGLQLGALLAGAVITEAVFDWPGLGLLLIKAIQARDYPLVQGCVLVIASAYVLANLLADLAVLWLDPRTRHAHA